MVNRFFKILLLFVIVPTAMYSQSDRIIEVNYIKAFKTIRDTTKTIPKTLKGLEYKLICNNDTAVFEYIPAMAVDGNRTNERFIGRSGGKGIYYKNLDENIKLHQVESLDENTYLVIENFNTYDWELQKETKKILGYDCYKAVAYYEDYSYLRKKKTILTITAWYAPSLPLPFGPSGYDGLPGLVLEASMSSFYFIADKVDIRENNGIVIKKPKKGKEVTYDEFNKILYEDMLKITRQ